MQGHNNVLFALKFPPQTFPTVGTTSSRPLKGSARGTLKLLVEERIAGTKEGFCSYVDMGIHSSGKFSFKFPL